MAPAARPFGAPETASGDEGTPDAPPVPEPPAEGSEPATDAPAAPGGGTGQQDAAPAVADGERLYQAMGSIPKPSGGAYKFGDRFTAKPDDPRARSNYARLVDDPGDDAPPAVAAALPGTSQPA